LAAHNRPTLYGRRPASFVLDRFKGTLDDGQKMRLGQVIGGFNDEN
jgi:hypothetical protein